MNNNQRALNLSCSVLGIGAWGPGFNNWQELSALLRSTEHSELVFNKPVAPIIPVNERRRAPLVVKLAIETSNQAITNSGLAPQKVACVFGSGIGDTEITDYLCRTLLTEEKLLSPTKFHNSVHNTAAGYWTISTGCMEAANSIAAYHYTAGLALVEAFCQCEQQQIPILITVYDVEVSPVLSELFPCENNIALSLLIAPRSQPANDALAVKLQVKPNPSGRSHSLRNPALQQVSQHNPAAALLLLLEKIADLTTNSNSQNQAVALPLSAATSIDLVPILE